MQSSPRLPGADSNKHCQTSATTTAPLEASHSHSLRSCVPPATMTTTHPAITKKKAPPKKAPPKKAATKEGGLETPGVDIAVNASPNAVVGGEILSTPQPPKKASPKKAAGKGGGSKTTGVDIAVNASPNTAVGGGGEIVNHPVCLVFLPNLQSHAPIACIMQCQWLYYSSTSHLQSHLGEQTWLRAPWIRMLHVLPGSSQSLQSPPGTGEIELPVVNNIPGSKKCSCHSHIKTALSRRITIVQSQ